MCLLPLRMAVELSPYLLGTVAEDHRLSCYWRDLSIADQIYVTEHIMQEHFDYAVICDNDLNSYGIKGDDNKATFRSKWRNQLLHKLESCKAELAEEVLDVELQIGGKRRQLSDDRWEEDRVNVCVRLRGHVSFAELLRTNIKPGWGWCLKQKRRVCCNHVPGLDTLGYRLATVWELADRVRPGLTRWCIHENMALVSRVLPPEIMESVVSFLLTVA